MTKTTIIIIIIMIMIMIMIIIIIIIIIIIMVRLSNQLKCYPPACVASDSVWFWSKERPRNGILGFGGVRPYLSSPPPPRSFTRAIFHD